MRVTVDGSRLTEKQRLWIESPESGSVTKHIVGRKDRMIRLLLS